MKNKNNLNFDKSNWEEVKFSDLYENITEKIKPKESSLEKYIGLEHLESNNLNIKNFGDSSSLKGDKLKIYKDDLILAKRNAYLKRVGLSSYDAIASAHSFVLRRKTGKMLNDLSPFFLLSENFWNKAIQISVGSLSPTINWKSIANVVFKIPNLNIQKRILETILRIETFVNDQEIMEKNLNIFLESLLYEEFFNEVNFNDVARGRIKNNKEFDYICLKEVSKLITDGTHKTPKYQKDGVPFLSTMNLVPFSKNFNFSKYKKYITNKEHDLLTKRCKPEIDDLLISKCGTIGITQVVRENFDFSIFVGLALVKLDKNKILPDYLELIFNTEIYKNYMELLAPGGTRSTLALLPIKNLIIPYTNIDYQKKIIIKFNNLRKLLVNLQKEIKQTKKLRNLIINSIF